MLVRTKGTTPREHANIYFESGERDNYVLNQIVDLFYLTRFVKLETVKLDRYKFIEYLERLDIDNTNISAKLAQVEDKLMLHE